MTHHDAHREASLKYERQKSASIRDIGDPPPVADPARRAACARSFRLFCETYFKGQFPLAWSPDHLTVIERIERVVLEGGQFAVAMPRGSGKTTLCEVAVPWSLLYGHRRFVVLIGSDQAAATQSLASIATHIETNDELAADFPEVCYPVRRLEGITQRSGGQMSNGERTLIGWTADEIVLPTIRGSIASGGIIRVAGITGRIRGMKHTRTDGTSARPDLVLIDDPQTDESARSPSQCVTRLKVVNGAVLGLAGPGKKIAVLMPCTVVARGDLADQVLDRKRNPNWQGERTSLMRSMPTDEKLWKQYADLYRACRAVGDPITPATDFYAANREAMDAGAEASWPARHNTDELSAIQHAMNLKLRDEAAFWAEYQNQPQAEEDDATPTIKTAAIVNQERLSKLPRGVVPIDATHLVGYIDVQGEALFYLVLAVKDDFTGWVVDYGIEPDQPPANLSQLGVKLSDMPYSDGSLESRVFGGLKSLMERMAGREWKRDGGGVLTLEKCLIDANWGDSSDTVYRAIRESSHANVFVPSHGKYIGAGSMPMSQYSAKPGEKAGMNWRLHKSERRAIRHVLIDTNWWKSFTANRISTAFGAAGSLALFGSRISQHELLAEHWTSEYTVRTEGRGRKVDEWKLRVSGLDNHWWDCLVGAYVAASVIGCGLTMGGQAERPAGRRKVKLSELQARRQA